MKINKPKIYTCGAMEFAEDGELGRGWREKIAADLLVKYELEILSSTEFEPDQLKGFRPNRLPIEFKARTGETIKPKTWHELKKAPRDSASYSRFKRMMRAIIHYDINLVENSIDYVICYWTAGAAKGAGSHTEISCAFRKHIPVFTVVKSDVSLPAWLEGASTRVFDSFDELYKFLEDEFCDFIKE